MRYSKDCSVNMSFHALSTRKGEMADEEMFYLSDEDEDLWNEVNCISASGEVAVSESASPFAGVRPDVLRDDEAAFAAVGDGSNDANPQDRVVRGKSTHKKRRATGTPPSATDEPKKQRRKRKSKIIASSWKDEIEHTKAQRAIVEEHQRQQEQLQLQQQLQRLQQLQIEYALLEQEQQQQMQRMIEDQMMMLQEQHGQVQAQQWGSASHSDSFHSEHGFTSANMSMHDATFDMHNLFSGGVTSTPYHLGDQQSYHPALFVQQTASLQTPMHTGAYDVVPQLRPWDAGIMHGEGASMFTPTDFTIPDDLVVQSPNHLPDGTMPFY